MKISSVDELYDYVLRHALFTLVRSGERIITILVRDFHETFFIHYYSVDSVHALKSRGEPSSLRWIAQDHVKTLQFLWEDQHSTPQDGSRFQARDQPNRVVVP